MKIEQLSIPGAYKITPRQFTDERGAFMEFFAHEALREATGRPFDLAQGNRSVSKRGVVRGIHFAATPPGQAKYVLCAAGSVEDVIVDIRPGSPTYGHHEFVTLDDADCAAVFISEGLGHGFVATSPEATVTYLCTTPYDPAREHGIHPFDEQLAIAWPDLGSDPILSDKDATAPSLQQATDGELLTDYATCAAWVNYLHRRG